VSKNGQDKIRDGVGGAWGSSPRKSKRMSPEFCWDKKLGEGWNRGYPEPSFKNRQNARPCREKWTNVESKLQKGMNIPWCCFNALQGEIPASIRIGASWFRGDRSASVKGHLEPEDWKGLISQISFKEPLEGARKKPIFEEGIEEETSEYKSSTSSWRTRTRAHETAAIPQMRQKGGRGGQGLCEKKNRGVGERAQQHIIDGELKAKRIEARQNVNEKKVVAGTSCPQGAFPLRDKRERGIKRDTKSARDGDGTRGGRLASTRTVKLEKKFPPEEPQRANKATTEDRKRGTRREYLSQSGHQLRGKGTRIKWEGGEKKVKNKIKGKSSKKE